MLRTERQPSFYQGQDPEDQQGDDYRGQQNLDSIHGTSRFRLVLYLNDAVVQVKRLTRVAR
jgi:hypothetical protein